MMKNTVVGNPGTTMPIDPIATATQPRPNHNHRTTPPLTVVGHYDASSWRAPGMIVASSVAPPS